MEREPGPRRWHPPARPVSPLAEKETSPAPTFSREEAAPPAATAAAAAAAPHAQRQQERHPAQPPRQHPRRRPELSAAYRPRRLRLPCPPGRGPPRLPRCVRFGRRRARPRVPPPRRSLAGSSRAHWLGPRAAPALTPGRPVTSRAEGGGSCIFMSRGQRSRLPRSRLRGPDPNFPPPSSRSVPEPWREAAGSPPPREPAPALQTAASGDGAPPRKVVPSGLNLVRGGAGDLPRHTLGADVRAEGWRASLRVWPLAASLEALCRLVWGGRQAHARAEKPECGSELSGRVNPRRPKGQSMAGAAMALRR